MKEKVLVSRDDVFADLGLADSEEMKIRSDLMSEVVKIIRNSGISQKEIAVILGITAPKVCRPLRSVEIGDGFPQLPLRTLERENSTGNQSRQKKHT